MQLYVGYLNTPADVFVATKCSNILRPLGRDVIMMMKGRLYLYFLVYITPPLK